jgi:hypothetical protein
VDQGTDEGRAGAPGRAAWDLLDLFLVSFTILFTELAYIRWFGSTVIYLTFFTNIVLLACFLGMSVGCMAAARPRNLVAMSLPLMLLAVGAGAWALQAMQDQQFALEVGGQRSPQQIYFGTEPAMSRQAAIVLPIEVGAGILFVLIALSFLGLGQLMGRLFDAVPNRIAAYSVNIAGSLAGIGAFAWASQWRTPPVVWFAVSVGLTLCYALTLRRLQTIAGIALLCVVSLHSTTTTNRQGKPWDPIFWSPYYKVDFQPETNIISTNNISHQQMVPTEVTGSAYSLVHLLNRDVDNPSLKNVLIIGAGSGNDVESALRFGAERVDAIEIDPVIQELGKVHHPKHPYNDPRVHYWNGDGRAFLRTTPHKYDLVVYALVDSLVLHTGYSSLRLENFLFTKQAFRDVERVLADDGLFVMYNYYRQGWVVGRLVAMAEQTFVNPPLTMSLPYQKEIKGTNDQTKGNHITGVIAGKKGSDRLEALRTKLRETDFWVHVTPKYNAEINAFGPRSPKVEGTHDEHWQRIGLARVDTDDIGPLPTDDWPFLYNRDKTIPWLTLTGMSIIAVLSLVVLAVFAPVRATRPDGAMFFLGAGFMLLETKGVVHMALLFGSTWVVNSIVFAAILVMILVANLFVAIVRPEKLTPYYVGLAITLLINALVPMDVFLSLPGAGRVVVSCLVVFLPVFFAGVVFAVRFRASERPDVALGSNVAGAILGGLAENLSLVLGYNHLLLVAFAFYALSLWAPGRRLVKVDEAVAVP